MDRDVVFLILQYNNVDVTLKCIQSIWKLEEQSRIRIVVVDNASADGAGEKLVEYMKKSVGEMQFLEQSKEKIYVFSGESVCEIDILCRKVNDGFSGGNNYGFQYIRGKYLFNYLTVANSDVEFVQEDFISQIEQEYNKSRFDILGPDIWAPNKKVHQNPMAVNIPSIREVSKTIFLNRVCILLFPFCFPLLKRYMQHGAGSNGLHITGRENVCLHGSCLIYSNKYVEFRTQLLRDYGEGIGEKLFYPETKLYYEEFLQTLWCRENGCKMVYTPNIRVNHMEGQATNSISTSEKVKMKFKMKNILHSAKIYKNELAKTTKEIEA